MLMLMWFREQNYEIHTKTKLDGKEQSAPPLRVKNIQGSKSRNKQKSKSLDK